MANSAGNGSGKGSEDLYAEPIRPDNGSGKDSEVVEDLYAEPIRPEEAESM